MKPEEGNLAATLFDAVILSRAIPNTAVYSAALTS